jgi:hypothetical protein
MLGRLFANPFTRPMPGSFGSESPTPGSVDDDCPSVPVSFLEEADTRNLLYGASFTSGSRVSLDVAKDIRVVVVSDAQCLDHLLFDGRVVRHEPSPERAPRGGDNSPLSRMSALTRSFSSTMLNASLTTTSVDGSIVVLPSPKGPLHHRRTSSSLVMATSVTASGSPSLKGSVEVGPETLSVPLLKETIFGYTPIRFGDAMTKVHPLPRNRAGLKSQRRTWLVSRVFKVGVEIGCEDERRPSSETSRIDIPDRPMSEPVPPHQGFMIKPQEVVSEYSDSLLPTWMPVPTINTATNPPRTKDVRCGVCVYFSLPTESQDTLTNHWEELCYALADLQNVVYKKLAEGLPRVLLEARKSRKPALKGRRLFSLDDDCELRSAVELFKTRFIAALRVPRVLCGQDRWSDLHREICWAVAKWDTVEDGCFLGAVTTMFIQFNSDLFQPDARMNVQREPPSRTVIICNNRIISRRLIFILASLLRNHTAEQVRRHMSFALSLAPGQQHVVRSDSGSISNSTNSSPRSRASAKFSTAEGGWEIPFTRTKIEPSQTVAIPHVIRPSFSSASLAHSLSKSQSRHHSIDGIRRSIGGSSSSFFSGFWQSDSQSETTVSSFEDYYEYDKHFDELSTSLPNGRCARPSLSRCCSSERTATTICRMTRAKSFPLADPVLHPLTDSEMAHSSDDGSITPVEYQVVDGGNVLEILPHPTSLNDSFDCPTPIVLPPVAGHIPEFHPDFIVQACPLTRDLDDRITRTMSRDADVFSETPGCRAVSRTLIINLRKREISERVLLDGCGAQMSPQQMSTNLMYSNGRPHPDCADTFQNVAKKLRAIVESPDLEALISAYESHFGVL